jgi:hypothetical protein
MKPDTPEIQNAFEVETEKPSAESFIRAAKNPVIIITESVAASWGSMAKYLLDTFEGVSIVFESDKAERDFRQTVGAERQRFANVYKGICDTNITPGQASDPLFTASDCLIIFGEPQFLCRALQDLETPLRPIFYNKEKGQRPSLSVAKLALNYRQ